MTEDGATVALRAAEHFCDSRTEELRAMFSDRMKIAISSEKIDAVRAAAERSNGSLLQRGEPIHRSLPRLRGGGDLYDYPLQFEHRKAHLQIGVRDGELAGLLLRPGNPTGRWNRSRGLLHELAIGTSAMKADSSAGADGQDHASGTTDRTETSWKKAWGWVKAAIAAFFDALP